MQLHDRKGMPRGSLQLFPYSTINLRNWLMLSKVHRAEKRISDDHSGLAAPKRKENGGKWSDYKDSGADKRE